MALKTKTKHGGGRPPKRAAERLSAQISIRMDPDLLARFEKLGARLPTGLAQRGAVVRRILEIGLGHVEADPSLLWSTTEERSKTKT